MGGMPTPPAQDLPAASNSRSTVTQSIEMTPVSPHQQQHQQQQSLPPVAVTPQGVHPSHQHHMSMGSMASQPGPMFNPTPFPPPQQPPSQAFAFDPSFFIRADAYPVCVGSSHPPSSPVSVFVFVSVSVPVCVYV